MDKFMLGLQCAWQRTLNLLRMSAERQPLHSSTSAPDGGVGVKSICSDDQEEETDKEGTELEKGGS